MTGDDLPENREAVENKRSSANVRPGEISLVRGGPFYRLQEAAGLVKDGHWNVGRRVLFGLGIGWFPLVLITLLFKTRALTGLLTDYPINVRMLVGVPLLLVGQTVMESAFRTIIGQIRAAALVTPSDAGHFDQILVSLIRLRDSIIPELIIIVAACLHAVEVVQTHMALARPWALTGSSYCTTCFYCGLVLRRSKPPPLSIPPFHQPLEVVALVDLPLPPVETRPGTGADTS